MSCYILNNNLIEELAESIRYAVDFPNNAGNIYLNTEALEFELMDCKKGTFHSSKKIAEKLYRFNELAYCGRYRDAKPSDIIPDFKEGRNLLINDRYRLMHILESYIYQVSEEATYSKPLFTALNDFLTSLYRSEIRKTEAYKKADLYA